MLDWDHSKAAMLRMLPTSQTGHQTHRVVRTVYSAVMQLAPSCLLGQPYIQTCSWWHEYLRGTNLLLATTRIMQLYQLVRQLEKTIHSLTEDDVRLHLPVANKGCFASLHQSSYLILH